MAASTRVEIDCGNGETVSLSNPDKVFFPQAGYTKMDLVEYYLAVGPGALAGVYERPTVLKRFPNGADHDFFFQKRAPAGPPWMHTVTVTFPSGRTATELCPVSIAHLIWAVNLGCIDFNPWAARRADLDHPDELRIDLDPQPGVAFADVKHVALAVRDFLAEVGLSSRAKSSGSRGIHIYSAIEPRWGFQDVRRAALVVARELERRMPHIATSAWWKEERGQTVFIDYNQNARDRTVASVWSVRPTPDARISVPLHWDEVPDFDPAAFTLKTGPARYAEVGDPWDGLYSQRGSLELLLARADEDAAAGIADAPWPPHFRSQEGEAPRVAPSRARKPSPRPAAKPRSTTKATAAPAAAAPAAAAEGELMPAAPAAPADLEAD